MLSTQLPSSRSVTQYQVGCWPSQALSVVAGRGGTYWILRFCVEHRCRGHLQLLHFKMAVRHVQNQRALTCILALRDASSSSSNMAKTLQS